MRIARNLISAKAFLWYGFPHLPRATEEATKEVVKTSDCGVQCNAEAAPQTPVAASKEDIVISVPEADADAGAPIFLGTTAPSIQDAHGSASAIQDSGNMPHTDREAGDGSSQGGRGAGCFVDRFASMVYISRFGCSEFGGCI